MTWERSCNLFVKASLLFQMRSTLKYITCNFGVECIEQNVADLVRWYLDEIQIKFQFFSSSTGYKYFQTWKSIFKLSLLLSDLKIIGKILGIQIRQAQTESWTIFIS